MDGNLPVILIEVVLTFGGVLLFGWWQLRQIRQDREKARAQRERAQEQQQDAAADRA